MKKFVSLALSALLVMSFVFPAFAVGESELESLIKTAKGRIDIPAGYTDFQSEKYSEANGEVSYYLRWSEKDKLDAGSIGVSINSRGDIIDFRKYGSDEDYGKKGIANFSAGEYAKKASDWVRRANPALSKELDFDVTPDVGNVYSSVVYVRFPRKVNGIPFSSDSISVGVNKYTGEVMSQTVSWTYVKNIPGTESIITSDAAVQKFGKLSGLSLQYVVASGKMEARLVYVPNMRDVMIDAVSGELFEVKRRDNENLKGDSAVMEDSAAESITNGRVELTEEEIASVEELSSLLSEEKIEKIIKEMANTSIQTCKITGVSYDRYKISESEYKYYANVTLRGLDGMYASARLDAATGELQSFRAYEVIDAKRSKLQSRDALRAAAVRFISAYAPDIAERVHDFSADASGGYFRYSRCENGVEYAGNGITITASEYTGKIVAYQRTWDEDITFEPTEGIISEDDALAFLFAASPIELMYVPRERGYSNPDVCDEACLVYMLNPDTPPYVSAKDGTLLDYSLEISEEKKSTYELQEDVRNHFSANAVKTLAENGIIVSDAELFKPDEIILQKEAILLIEKLGGGYYPYVTDVDYESLMREAQSRGILKEGEISPDSAISREDAVCCIVRALNFGKAAEIRGIYNAQFKDASAISESRVGYVAIARGLGIVNGDGKGCFNPKSGVTRGEFSVMLCNALKGVK